MNPREFFEEIRRMYLKARNLKYKNNSIKRGRSHFISSATEDLVAFYLSENLNNEYYFYVDQPIKIQGRRNARYIDIIITKENIIKNIIDIKMDLGWHRGGFDYKQIIKLLDDIRGNKFKKGEELIGSNECRYHFVIISGENISEAKMRSVVDELKKYERDISYYILSHGMHPNEYVDDENYIWQKIKINNDEFRKMIENAKN